MEDGRVSQVGDVRFDAADRLAIINLFGEFAYTYDELRFDEFRALFTDSAEVRWLFDGEVLVEGLDTTIGAAQARLKAFKAQKIQRRHGLSSFTVLAQSATRPPDAATRKCWLRVRAGRPLSN